MAVLALLNGTSHLVLSMLPSVKSLFVVLKQDHLLFVCLFNVLLHSLLLCYDLICIPQVVQEDLVCILGPFALLR